MSLLNVLKISAQGMSAQRERLESSSANLANANTTRTPEGGPYRRRDTVFAAVQLEAAPDSFGPRTEERTTFDTPFGRSLWGDGSLNGGPLEGVQTTTELADRNQVQRRYQPGHPDADANGYVSLPEVDALEETVNLLSAARSFEANATAFNTAKELARASLKLGEG